MATTMEPSTEGRSRGTPPPPASGRTPEASKRARSCTVVFGIMSIVLLGLVVFAVRKWWFGRNHVSTDDAQVDGHIVPILPKVGRSEERRVGKEGRARG